MMHPLPINMWLGIAVELALLTGLMGGLALYHRRRPLSPELSRKLFHMGGGLTVLSFPWMFSSAWPVFLLALITLPSLLALKYIRAFKGNLGSVLYRVDRSSRGELYFPLSVCVLFACVHEQILLFLIPVLILTLADPSAALIGSRYGRLHYIFVRGSKSIEGSAAFFFVAGTCVLVPLLLCRVTYCGEALLIALLVGLLATLAEAIAWDGLDNLFIPLCSCLLLAGLLQLDGRFLLLNLFFTLCLLGIAFWLARRRAVRTARMEGRIC